MTNVNPSPSDTYTPGSAALRKETAEKTKRIPKNVKFNRAFDVAKVQAEVLSQQSQDIFLDHLRASKSFLSMLRLGLSEEILQYLDKPEDYKIVKINEESPEVSENIDTNLVNNTLVSLKYPTTTPHTPFGGPPKQQICPPKISQIMHLSLCCKHSK